MKILEKIGQKQLLLGQGVFSAALLSGALAGQYGFNLYPCELCMLQRYPYMAIIVISLLASFLLPASLRRCAAWVCVLLLAMDAGVAIYHTGVEFEWFPGPTACSSSSTAGQTLEEMRAAIMNAPLVSCGQAQAYVLGLSLAAWNAILATLMTLACIAVLLKDKRA